MTRFAVEPPRHRASSAASQSHSDLTGFDRDLNHNYSPSPDVSPPGTPSSLNRGLDNRDSSQISPIEEEPQLDRKSEQMEAKFASHLPMRKDPRKGNFPVDPSIEQSSSRRSRGTQWDDYSGEPSTSGKTGQAAPGSMQFTSKPAGNRVLSWGKEQLQPKKKLAEVRSRMSKQNDDAPLPVSYEPWKGPTGRAPIMDPIYEKPRAGSSSSIQPSGSSDRLREHVNASPDPASRLRPSVVTTITASQDKQAGTKKPTAPRNRAPSTSTNSRPSVSESYKSSAPPRVDLPEPELHSPLAELKLASAPAPMENDEHQPEQSELPVSRSGAATDTPAEASTRASTPGSLDSTDTASRSNENIASIMSRKRPVPSNMAPGKKPVRKPTPSQAAEDAASKGLPVEPPQEQQQPKDRIEALEERQNTLIRRKTNITTIIDELNLVFQPTSTAYDMTAREEVKKTIGGLNNELSEIRREEHEIGLKLLRAWKKRDEQDLYGGGTGLWVKRVTS